MAAIECPKKTLFSNKRQKLWEKTIYFGISFFFYKIN